MEDFKRRYQRLPSLMIGGRATPAERQGYPWVRSRTSACHAIWIASNFASFDFAGSSLKSGSAVTYLCRSVKRTARGSSFDPHKSFEKPPAPGMAHGATRAKAGAPPILRVRLWCILTVSITKMLCLCGAIA